MKNSRFGRNLLSIAILMFAFAIMANAQATRTWVSGVGDDANPCSRTAPCKTFAGAISKTATDGEIDCLDPGGFGAVTITKGITIDCDGTFGSILASLTTGVIINAPAGSSVRIRAVSINGAGNGISGIRMIGGGSLFLDEVYIQGFTTHCLDISLSGANKANVTIKDSSFRKCGTNAAAPGSSGIHGGNGTRLVMAGSTITDVLFGVTQQDTVNSGAASVVFISGSTVAHATDTAFKSVAGSFIGVSGNTLINNNLIFNQNGGEIDTASDSPGFGNVTTGTTNGPNTIPKF